MLQQDGHCFLKQMLKALLPRHVYFSFVGVKRMQPVLRCYRQFEFWRIMNQNSCLMHSRVQQCHVLPWDTILHLHCAVPPRPPPPPASSSSPIIFTSRSFSSVFSFFPSFVFCFLLLFHYFPFIGLVTPHRCSFPHSLRGPPLTLASPVALFLCFRFVMRTCFRFLVFQLTLVR